MVIRLSGRAKGREGDIVGGKGIVDREHVVVRVPEGGGVECSLWGGCLRWIRMEEVGMMLLF